MILLGVIEWLIAITYAMPWGMLAQSVSELRIVATMVPAWFASIMLSVCTLDHRNHKAITVWLVIGTFGYTVLVAIINHSMSLLLPIGPIIGTILLVRIMRVDEEHDRAQRMIRRFPIEVGIYGISIALLLLIPVKHPIVPTSITIVAVLAYMSLRCASFVVAQRKIYMTFSSALIFGGILTAVGLVMFLWSSIMNALSPVIVILGLPFALLVEGWFLVVKVYVGAVPLKSIIGPIGFLLVIVSVFIYFGLKRLKMNMTEKQVRIVTLLMRILPLVLMGVVPLLYRALPVQNLKNVMGLNPFLHPNGKPSRPVASGAAMSDIWLALGFVVFAAAFFTLIWFIRRRIPSTVRIYHVGLGATKKKEIQWVKTTSPVRLNYQTFLQGLVSKGVDLSESDTTRSLEARAYGSKDAEKRSLIARLTRLYETTRYGDRETSEMARLAEGITKRMDEDLRNIDPTQTETKKPE